MTPEQIEAATDDAQRVLNDLAIMLEPLRDPKFAKYAGRAIHLPWPGRSDLEWVPKAAAKALAGDSVADDVLGKVLAIAVERGVPIPIGARDYVAAKLRGTIRHRRQKKPFGTVRDGYIVVAILIVMQHGFLPTRNRGSRTESACSIVSEALSRATLGTTTDEAAVEKIWQQWMRHFRDAGIDPRSLIQIPGERPNN